jgi:hypothetical protein
MTVEIGQILPMTDVGVKLVIIPVFTCLCGSSAWERDSMDE